MKKFAVAVTFLGLTGSSQLQSDILLEAKAAYFYPLDSTTRKIYSGTGVYGLELSVETCWNLYPWISGDFVRVNGRSIGEEDKTTLTLVPLGIGLKYVFCGNCFRPYLGLGFGATYLHTHDESIYVKQNRTKWGYGLIAKAGSYVYFTRCWFFDFFVDYTWMKMDFNGTSNPFTIGRDADVSNISAGAGIGFNF